MDRGGCVVKVHSELVRNENMAFLSKSGSSSAEPGSVDLKLVSRVALLTSLGSIILLVVSVLFLTDLTGNSYAEIVYSHSVTQKNLKPVLLISGLCLLVFVTFITWLITLYSSFRIAGPLFRFAQNLKQAGKGIKPIGIREGDALQDVSRLLLESVTSLHSHYQDIDKHVAQILGDLDKLQERNVASLESEIKALKKRVRQVQADE